MRKIKRMFGSLQTGKPVGFVALWLNKDCEYRAGAKEEQETGAKIENAFQWAREQGVKMYGRFGSRWSSERQYFTFWLCPSFEILDETMDRLTAAGDFKFADSEHIVGLQLDDTELTDKVAIHEIPDLKRKSESPLGFLALWNMKDASFHAPEQEWDETDRAVRDVFLRARDRGVLTFGNYNCRWSSRWDYFTFMIIPDMQTLDWFISELEPAGDFKFADSRHIIGIAEPQYRFGVHLQRYTE